MNKLMYTRPDGGVSIVIPAAKDVIEKVLGSLTDEQYEAHVRERSIPNDATNVVSILDADVPTDREFRNAWKQNDTKVGFDLDKAKDIQLEKIRRLREPKLLEQDKLFMLALEKGQDTSAIVAEKQKLRDITEPLIALVPTSIEDIKNAFPPELKEQS